MASKLFIKQPQLLAAAIIWLALDSPLYLTTLSSESCAYAQAKDTTNLSLQPKEKISRFSAVLQDATSNCDRANSGMAMQGIENENLDILARANKALAVKEALNLPSPREAVINQFALEAVILNDSLGNLTDGDKYDKLFKEQAGYPRTLLQPAVLAILTAAGRKRETDIIEQSLTDSERKIISRLASTEKPEKPGEPASESRRATFELTRHCLNAIENNDKKVANSDASKILALYKSETEIPERATTWTFKRQNLFCTVLNISRRFSDKGYIADSTALLKDLLAASITKRDWTTANSFILIELAVNAERQKANSLEQWQSWEKQACFARQPKREVKGRAKPDSQANAVQDNNGTSSPITYDYTTSEKLRRLAVAFYCAGELDRASLLIAQALKTYSPTDKITTPENHIIHCRDAGIAGDHVLLLLDAARIRASQNKFDEADKLIAEALSGPPLSEQPYGVKLADLSDIYAKTNRHSQAIALLKTARAKDIPHPDHSSRHSATSAFTVDYWLAKALFESGKKPEARTIIESAIAQSLEPAEQLAARTKTRVTPRVSTDCGYEPSILAGDCALAANDFKAASMRYEQAGLSHRFGTLAIDHTPPLNQYWLQKALDCSDKVSDFAKEDKSRLFMELASTFRNSDRQKAFDLNKKAASLMDDSNPEKARLLTEMAYLSTASTGLPNTAAIFSNPISTTYPAYTSEQNSDNKPTSSKNSPQINLLRQAAQIAEKNNEPNAVTRYVALAQAEASIGALDQAISDAQHAIQTYTGARESLTDNSLLGIRYRLIGTLNGQGRTADSIKLMEAAIARMQIVKGSDSAEALQELFCLLEFYVEQHDDSNALLTLERILAKKMRPGPAIEWAHFSSHGPRIMTLDIAYEWAKRSAKSNSTLALTVPNMILTAQQKQLAPDDIKLFDTLILLADIQHLLNDDKAAASNCRNAFKIRSLYDGEKNTLRRMPAWSAEVLRKSGDELGQQIDEIKNQPYKIENTPTRQDWRALSLDELKSQYEKAKAEAPYSSQTKDALGQLAAIAKNKQDWKLAADCILKQIAFVEHNSSYIEQKVDLQKSLIEIYIKSDLLDQASNTLVAMWNSDRADGNAIMQIARKLIEAQIKASKTTEAKKETRRLFQQQSRWLPNLKSFYDVIPLGQICIATSETKYLAELLTKGESMIPENRGLFYLPQLAELWKKFGNEKHAKELTERYDTFIANTKPGENGRPPMRPPMPREPVLVRTKTGMEFDPPATSKGYSFNFAALASDSLTFGDQARLWASDKALNQRTPPVSFAGCYGELKAAQRAHHAGSLSFVYGISPGLDHSIMPYPKLLTGVSGGGSVATGQLVNLPAVQTPPFKTAAEVEVVNGTVGGMQGQGLQFGLSPGDYRIFSLGTEGLKLLSPGRLRLFLPANAETKSPVFHAQPGALINAESIGGPAPKGCTLEIWYNGTGTIKLDRDSTFNGVIYAPNGRIEIGPANATFTGAMVAKTIDISGESKIYYDPQLLNWKETP